MTLTNSTLSGNTGRMSAAASTTHGTLTLSNSTLAGNYALEVGGGIYNTAR